MKAFSTYSSYLVLLDLTILLQAKPKELNKAIEICLSGYREVYERKLELAAGDNLAAHFGVFSMDKVSIITSSLEQLILNSGEKKSTAKRMFSILIEGLQNIRIHSTDDEFGDKTAFLVINRTENLYSIQFGNVVQNEDVAQIRGRLEMINGCTLSEVKNLYLQVLTEGIISKKGGAGLGFITMGMKSRNSLKFQFERMSEDRSCFVLEVVLGR